MIFLQLYWEFFKIGLFAVGGGLATLPFLSDLSASTGWFTQNQLADMIAVSESTPGPIGTNMATYVGFTAAGIPGALAATLGEVTPSIIIILVIARFLESFRQNRFVNSTFLCLRPASVALITISGLSVASSAFLTLPDVLQWNQWFQWLDWKAVVLAAVLIVVTQFVKPTKKVHPIVWILASGVVGICFRFAGV